MTQFKHVMEVFQLLNKSNCRKCGKKTCLSFAAGVFKGDNRLDECPVLDHDILQKYRMTKDHESQKKDAGDHSRRENNGRSSAIQDNGGNAIQENRDAFQDEMKNRIARIDLNEAAERTGGIFDGKRLTFKILGKDFSVDQSGKIYTGIHVNPWIVIPAFSYILNGQGFVPSGKWVSFRELKDGRERYPLFKQRCEIPMKQVADSYTELFDNIVSVLNGRQVEKAFQSDISVVMTVMPKVPIMICYWTAAEGLGSNLNIYFDETADRNLDIGSIFSLGAGLTQMFTRMSITHGHDSA
ncbi:MAG: DUF3786 domain-containing protein [Desulfamplus sp.]|nr:DUF3786 domain-containing protein [Desulfamplus sp.]